MAHNESVRLDPGQDAPGSDLAADVQQVTPPSYILALADPRATLANVGGKGASLARLASAGLPVPTGFYVTTAAYRRFVAENNLQPGIVSALRPVDVARPATLEAAARAIGDLFAQAHMPGDIATAIAQAYASLPGEHLAVAVRSSATAEDLPERSFAGQHETFLNIQGVAAVQAAVKRCWASLWTARAIGYRAQQGIDPATISLAVVVQLLVPAEAAGVLFTANPVSGQRDQAVITAAWGLGEAIVGGLVTPDTLTIDKASGRVLARATADKQRMTVLVEHGTAERPVPEMLRRTPVLDDQAAAALVRLGVQIEQLYQRPMDIEWTRAAGQFAIVQARPITALPEPEAPTPMEWKLPDPKGQYVRGSIIEQLPDPLTPLFATLGRDVIDAATKRLFTAIAGQAAWIDPIIVTINGYAYLNFHFTTRQWLAVLAGVMRAMPQLLGRAEQRWRDEAHPRYVDIIERWQAKPVRELSAQELLVGARQLLDGAVTIYTTLQSGLIPMSTMTEELFTQFYNRFVKRAGDPPATTYLLGFDSTPIRAEKELFDLAAWARARVDLAAYVVQTPAQQLATHLAHDQAPPAVEAGAWREWQRRFQAYLRQYGHTIYDLDFANPVPADDPTPLLETCKLFITGQSSNPYARQQSSVSRRRQATTATLQRLSGLRLALFQKLIMWAQQYGPLREDGLADIGLGYPLLRQLLRELGRRLVQAGAIEQADDIFWLYQTEVEQAAVALDTGNAVGKLAEAVQQRKAVWRAVKRVRPPVMLPSRARWFGFDMEKWLPARAGEQVGDTIKGVAASPGRVTATARVLHGPDEFDQMRAGDVLVAAITTPAWMPLFARAAGIVTDVGGPLSHSSIVAREYGIPAVLGTGVATRRIQSGQRITMDGSAGLVILLQDRENG